MKKLRVLLLTLCVAVFMCGFTVTAHAGGGDEYIEPTDQWEGLEEPTPTTEPGEGFSDEGNLVTRDLLYDEHTNKQFITVQTSGGNTFYIVIDYDKPVDEDGEQYETYFFSIVDEADLLAAMEAAGMEVPACACTDKCMAGAINTDCPVCATNMTECVGVEPEPVEDTEPVDDPEPEQPKVENNNIGTIILIVAVALIGGGNSALQEAILLSEGCKKVYVIQNLDFLTGEKRLEEILRKRGNVEIITGTVVKAIPDGDVLDRIVIERVADHTEQTLEIDGMFVAIGLVPENDAFASVASLDERGYYASGEDCLTETAGVFVAGDCRQKGVRQVATATGDGAVAAIAACRYIDSF